MLAYASYGLRDMADQQSRCHAFPIFAADVVVQNNDRPEIAEVIKPSHTKTHTSNVWMLVSEFITYQYSLIIIIMILLLLLLFYWLILNVPYGLIKMGNRRQKYKK